MPTKVVNYIMRVYGEDVIVAHNESDDTFSVTVKDLSMSVKEWEAVKATVEDMLRQAGYVRTP